MLASLNKQIRGPARQGAHEVFMEMGVNNFESYLFSPEAPPKAFAMGVRKGCYGGRGNKYNRVVLVHLLSINKNYIQKFVYFSYSVAVLYRIKKQVDF